MSDTRTDSFIRPFDKVDGILMRPLTSGSYAILHRTGNAFVVPNADQDHLSAALEYAYIHGAHLEAVLRAAYASKEVFRAEVFKFSESIPPAKIPQIIAEVEAGLTAAASQSVDVLPRPGSEDKDAPPNS